MPFQVIPRELGFYPLLERAAGTVVRATRELLALAEDPFNGAEARAAIEELEREGDDLTHRILALLNSTFVTPFDRSDIHELASSLDDILDMVHAVAERLILYQIETSLPQFRQQCRVLADASGSVLEAVVGLRSMGPADRALLQIKRSERDGDHVFRQGVAALYAGDYRAMDVLKWRDIFEQLESAIDRCEDVANVVESILVKYD